mgnify:CR=1 FL=1
MIAKNRETAQQLTSLFRIRKIHKTYLALSFGQIQKSRDLIENKLIETCNLAEAIYLDVIHKEYFNRSRNMTRAINSEPIKVKPWSVVSQATMVNPIRRPYKYVERFLKPPSNPNSY